MFELRRVTLTVADALADPPARYTPERTSLRPFSAPVLDDPLVARAPLQRPLQHAVALVLDESGSTRHRSQPWQASPST